MKTTDWRTTAELIGIAAIVASLVFVGLQVQQQAVATRSATVLQLKDSWIQLNLAFATSVELADSFQAIDSQGWAEADYRAKSLVRGFYRALFHNWSNAYYQYSNGTLDQSQWAPHLREVVGSTNNPVARQIWSGGTTFMTTHSEI
jgi:hypothetical protein